MQKEKKQFLKKIFGERSLFVTIILMVVMILCLVSAWFGCNKIAEDRALAQMDDAVNAVIDQVNSKFESDSQILNAAAKIIATSGAIKANGEIDEDRLHNILNRIGPLRNTMNFRVLLPGNVTWWPEDESPDDASNGFDFEQMKELGEHISGRFESLRAGKEGTLLIAHFVPINFDTSIFEEPEIDENVSENTPKVEDGETIAMLYGVTVLEELPDIMKVSNIYNSQASVAIVDRKTHELIMDTWHDGELGSLDDFDNRKIKGGKSFGEAKEDLLKGNRGSVQLFSDTTREWLYIYYAPASGVVADQWSVYVSIPHKVAFKNVTLVSIVFIIIGIIMLIALVLYFIWIKLQANKAITNSVERAVLEERLHKAEAAERAKTTFLSNMSHDIRTPMNAILGFTALAETNIDNKERVQDYLKKILSSGNHLLSLINDILDMSRIESGKLNIEEKPCSISDVFKDMRNIIQTQMKSKQLCFFMDTLDVVDEDIFCDRLHLNQVLLNLLSNSIKFTPPGGTVSLMIRQKSGAPTGYGAYEIRVKDTGIGMSKEFAEHIFEPFERERTSTVSGIQGTGLGMAITKNIIDTMGGTIEVETQKDKGTEFIINLQFRLQTERKHFEVIQELEGLRALVVDDNFDTCDSVSKMLMQIGMRSEWTLYGKEAVLRAQQAIDIGDKFSAYIIDWVMPDLSGFEIVRQIRKIVGDDVPIIIITAYDVSAIMEEAKEVGITAYCNKPIFLSELRETLISCISKNVSELSQNDKANSVKPVIEQFVGKRLLLVEDNELNREIAEEILKENGFVVETAEDGTYAVDMVKNSTAGYYDLVLMDIQMPKMDGYEATRAIRSLDNKALANVPIVAMTANAFDEDKKKAAEAGMDAHVAKPINIDQLLEVLQDILTKKNKK